MFRWSLFAVFAASVGRLLPTDEYQEAACLSSDHEGPNVRSNFVQLLATNPNYFGNVPKSGLDPVHPLANDVTFEELIAVGFNPPLDILSATIEVKLDVGFDGDLCTNGSYEYVRFWVDYGAGWDNAGYVSVNTHDIANQTDCDRQPEKPLFYTLSLPFVPTSKNCSVPVFPNIRAILSWHEIPPDTDPDWSPVWGNPLDQHVQARLNSSIPALTAQDVMLYASSELDEPKDICTHDDDTSKSRAREQHKLTELSDSQKILDGTTHQTAVNTNWEEVVSLGLDFSLSSLVATFKVKLPDGFGTDPCHNGTIEYVSFWADWENTCNYTFLGTRQINVHDFASLPPDGLAYTAIMPVNTTRAQSFCNETKVARVRAALSWDTPPPEPPALPTYGNWLEKHVQLQPYTIPPGTQGEINVIGNVAITSIDTASTGMTLSTAQFSFPQISTDPSGLGRPSPFGGLIRIQCVGCTPLSNTVYRVMARPFNPFNPLFPGNPITDIVTVTDLTVTPPRRVQYPLDADGYFPYVQPAQNLFGDLAFWHPIVDGLYQIRLETATLSLPRTHIGYTQWYNVRVNNEVPIGDVEFTSGTCSEIFVGQDLTGAFFASMPHSPQFLEGWSLGVIPSGIPHTIVPSSGTDAVPPVPPDASGKAVTPWTLETTLGQACGYVVALYVRALTVYNSVSDPLVTSVYRGFCLRNSE